MSYKHTHQLVVHVDNVISAHLRVQTSARKSSQLGSHSIFVWDAAWGLGVCCLAYLAFISEGSRSLCWQGRSSFLSFSMDGASAYGKDLNKTSYMMHLWHQWPSTFEPCPGESEANSKVVHVASKVELRQVIVKVKHLAIHPRRCILFIFYKLVAFSWTPVKVDECKAHWESLQHFTRTTRDKRQTEREGEHLRRNTMRFAEIDFSGLSVKHTRIATLLCRERELNAVRPDQKT